jgi:hypothetical protein
VVKPNISGILEHEEYIGTTINCRSYIPSFKSKKSFKILRQISKTENILIDPRHSSGSLFKIYIFRIAAGWI